VRRAGRLAVLVLLMAGQSGCAPQPVADARMPRADGRPRVMSLNPCIDAILLRVADPDQILSISHYSHDPRSSSVDVRLARRHPANFETAEEVVALRPDVVLIGPHVAPATRSMIRSVGVRVVIIDVPGTIAQSREEVRAVARAIGYPARGDALVGRIDAALARAAPPRGAPPVPAIIRQSGGLVPGTGTLPDDLLARTGFRNLSADYSLKMWDILPLEVMMVHPPRVVLSDLADGRSQEHGLPQGVGGMRVAHFPDRLFQCAGPNLIEAAGRLARIRAEAAGA
jgi:iron complex transport system substrate-binding protein